FSLCLSMLSAALMIQAAPTWNEDDTSTSGDGSTALAASPVSIAVRASSATEEVKEVFVPQATIAAIISLVDGFVLACFDSSKSGETEGPHSRKFMAGF